MMGPWLDGDGGGGVTEMGWGDRDGVGWGGGCGGGAPRLKMGAAREGARGMARGGGVQVG